MAFPSSSALASALLSTDLSSADLDTLSENPEDPYMVMENQLDVSSITEMDLEYSYDMQELIMVPPFRPFFRRFDFFDLGSLGLFSCFFFMLFFHALCFMALLVCLGIRHAVMARHL
jgi:hypothetical protein